MVNALWLVLGLLKRLELVQEGALYSFCARSRPVAVGNLQGGDAGLRRGVESCFDTAQDQQGENCIAYAPMRPCFTAGFSTPRRIDSLLMPSAAQPSTGRRAAYLRCSCITWMHSHIRTARHRPSQAATHLHCSSSSSMMPILFSIRSSTSWLSTNSM